MSEKERRKAAISKMVNLWTTTQKKTVNDFFLCYENSKNLSNCWNTIFIPVAILAVLIVGRTF